MNGVIGLFKKAWNTVSTTARYLHRSSPNYLRNIRNELIKFDGGSVDLHIDNKTGVAIMTLNNPRRMNAMTGKMMVNMSDCVRELEQWKEGKGLILRGEGGNLCTGGDLNFVKKALHYGDEMARFQHDTLTRLQNLSLISVALIQGHTLGGGAELCTACDFRVMSPQAEVGFVQIKMGLSTAWGAATRLTKLLGRRKALGLLCSAEILQPSAALKIGLVDFVLPEACADELLETRAWLLENYCAYDATLVRAMKSSVVKAEHSADYSVALENERKLFAETWGGPAQLRALEANIKHRGSKS